jgi:putative oxidoreductase
LFEGFESCTDFVSSIREVRLQRLFSTFPDGLPGTGILLLRLVAGIVLIYQSLIGLPGANLLEPATQELIAAGAGILLLVGLWTPMAGVLVVLVELWIAISRPSDLCTTLLLGALGAGLAMLGPGAWSIDARLFGRRRIEIGNR